MALTKWPPQYYSSIFEFIIYLQNIHIKVYIRKMKKKLFY